MSFRNCFRLAPERIRKTLWKGILKWCSWRWSAFSFAFPNRSASFNVEIQCPQMALKTLSNLLTASLPSALIACAISKRLRTLPNVCAWHTFRLCKFDVHSLQGSSWCSFEMLLPGCYRCRTAGGTAMLFECSTVRLIGSVGPPTLLAAFQWMLLTRRTFQPKVFRSLLFISRALLTFHCCSPAFHCLFKESNFVKEPCGWCLVRSGSESFY